jgi:hypothetical protein
VLGVGQGHRPGADLAVERVLQVVLPMGASGVGPRLGPEVGHGAGPAELQWDEVVELVIGERCSDAVRALILSRLIGSVTDTGGRTVDVYPDRQMVVERVSGVTRESASPRVQTGSGRKPLSLAWHEPGGAGEPVVIAIEPAPGEVVELVGGEHPTNPRTTMTSRAGRISAGRGPRERRPGRGRQRHSAVRRACRRWAGTGTTPAAAGA